MAQQSRKHPRRLLFVHPHFQGWFIGKVVALMFASSVVSSLGLYYLADDFVATTKRAAQVGALHWWGKFGPILIGTNIAALLVTTVVTVYVVLYASHKVVGPLVRVHRVLEEIGEGRFHREIRLREGDELADTVVALLEMEARLAHRMDAVRESLVQLEHNPDRDSIAKVKEAVQQLPDYPTK